MIFSAGAFRKCRGIRCQDITNDGEEEPEEADEEGRAHGEQGGRDVSLDAAAVAPAAAVAQKTLFKIVPTSRKKTPDAPPKSRRARAAAVHVLLRVFCD